MITLQTQFNSLQKNYSSPLSNETVNNKEANKLLQKACSYAVPDSGLLRAYFTQPNSKISFAGTPTNYLIPTVNGYIPLVIEPYIDLTDTIGSLAYPGLKCSGGDWTKAYLKDVYLKGSELPGSKFIEADMREIKLHKSNLSKSDFSYADCGRARFDNSNFKDVVFYRTKLEGATFQNSDLSGADLTGAYMKGANFIGADLRNIKYSANSNFSRAFYDNTTKFPSGFNPEKNFMINFRKGVDLSHGTNHKILDYTHLQGKDWTERSDYQNINFRESLIRDVFFKYIDFEGADFSDVEGKGATFFDCLMYDAVFNSGSDFEGANFQNSNFEGAKFNGANLKKTNLIGAQLIDSDITKAPIGTLTGAIYDQSTSLPVNFNPTEHFMKCLDIGIDLSGYDLTRMKLRNNNINSAKANLQDAKFVRCDLKETDFSEINLKNADFSYAYMAEADFSGANMENAKLFAANMPNINLKGANLRNADLRWAKMPGAILDGADLTGATYIEGPNTIFPTGFNPKEHGMIAVPIKMAS